MHNKATMLNNIATAVVACDRPGQDKKSMHC